MSPYVSNLLAATKSKWNAWANVSLWAAQRLRGSSRARVVSPVFTQLGGNKQPCPDESHFNTQQVKGVFSPLEEKSFSESSESDILWCKTTHFLLHSVSYKWISAGCEEAFKIIRVNFISRHIALLCSLLLLMCCSTAIWRKKKSEKDGII